MDAPALISLPNYETVKRDALAFLTSGLDVAIIGPPGCGASAIGLSIQMNLAAEGIASTYFDCLAEGNFAERLNALTAPPPIPKVIGGTRKAMAAFLMRVSGFLDGQNWHDSRRGATPKCSVIIIDHGSYLTAESFNELVGRLARVTAKGSIRMLWLGCLDSHKVRRDYRFQFHTDNRTHLCVPELERDDLLRIYRAIVKSKELVWGEAMLYFALDWCGNDLALAEQLVEYFCGNWTEKIYDEAVAECLRDWLVKCAAVNDYRERFAALPDACKNQLRLLCGGGKLVSHRPEVHLETSEDMRRLFLEGFLCANLLPGYYQFRNLVARFVVEEEMGLATNPIGLLRRAANARVNLLLQDVEVSLREMLRTILRLMSLEEVKNLFKSIRAQHRLIDEDFRPKLMDWAAQQTQPGQPDLRAGLGQFLSQESTKFFATNNLWSEVCSIFRETYGLENANAEPTPEQAVSCLTFSQLSDLLQKLSTKLFLEKPRSKLSAEPPSKRWPGYLARVRRLRNDTAHLRNISFQDIEDLLRTLGDIRRDQLDFGIIP